MMIMGSKSLWLTNYANFSHRRFLQNLSHGRRQRYGVVMELIVGLIVIWVAFSILRGIYRFFTEDSGDYPSGHMESLNIKLSETHLDKNDPTSPSVIEIALKGLVPLTRKTEIQFVTSLFDTTDGSPVPVISTFSQFQEPASQIYQYLSDPFPLSPNSGYTDWVSLGAIFPTFLQPPYGGKRTIDVRVRMIDAENRPAIAFGFLKFPDHPGMLWEDHKSFTWAFQEKGWKEIAAHRKEAFGIVLQVGVAVAMEDGSLHDKEGLILKNWILRVANSFPEKQGQEHKTFFNGVLKTAYGSAKNGDLKLSTLTNRLDEIGEKSLKYETVELCFDIMAADGVADERELRIIRNIADSLQLDVDEIEKIREQKMVGLDTKLSGRDSEETFLGIEPNWPLERKRKHLPGQFRKWSDRLNTLPEGKDRDSAQKMLDLIAKLKKQYG